MSEKYKHRPLLVLVESDGEDRAHLKERLSDAHGEFPGFSVIEAKTKTELERILDSELIYYIDGILCEAHTLDENGNFDGWAHEVCYKNKNSLRGVFIAGMSDHASNRNSWGGIASHGGFYIKSDLGKTISGFREYFLRHVQNSAFF